MKGPQMKLRTWAFGVLGYAISWLAIASFALPLPARAQATLVPNAIQQFFDSNGNPISSGTVGFYQPGTTNPKTVWQDSGQTTPYGNPIVLNAAGEPNNAAGIWGTGTYRQIVQDANGGIIWDALTATTASTSPGSSGDGMPLGFIMPYAGAVAPTGYDFAYGQAYNRTTFASLLAAITITQSGSCTNGSATITGLTDTTSMGVGQPLESSCFPSSTTVNSVVSSTSITASTTATGVTGAYSFQIFPFGNGNGSTTFNLPDLRGYVPAGRDNMGGTAAARLTTASKAGGWDYLGASGGVDALTLSTAQLPSHTHDVAITDPLHLHAFVYQNPVTVTVGGATAFATSISNTTGNSFVPTQLSATGITASATSTGGGVATGASLGSLPTSQGLTAAALSFGGASYSNGTQVLTVQGGTCSTQPTVSTTVSGGIVTSINSIPTPGVCTAPPNQYATLSDGTHTTALARITMGNGSGYTTGAQVLTVVGGTCATAPQVNVTVAGASVVAVTSIATAGSCAVPPVNPVATTGGGGIGAVLDIVYSTSPLALVQPTQTINYVIKVSANSGGYTVAIANNSVLGNFSGMTAPPVATAPSVVVGFVCNTRGALFEVKAGGPGCLNPGTAGYVMTSNGTGADPSYQPAPGGGSGPITGPGVSVVNDIVCWANVSGTRVNDCGPPVCTNIQFYGGNGNGVAANDSAWTAAVAALGSQGGCISFPSGKYLFNSAISATMPNSTYSIAVMGSGTEQTILYWPNANGGITINYTSPFANSAFLSNFTCTTAQVGSGTCIKLASPGTYMNTALQAPSLIQNVTCRGADGWAVTDYWTTCFAASAVSNVNFDKIMAQGPSSAAGTGLSLAGVSGEGVNGAVAFNVSKSFFIGLSVGINYGAYVQGVTVDQTNFTSNAFGIYAPATMGGNLDELLVTNSQCGPTTNGTCFGFARVVDNVGLMNNLILPNGGSSVGINAQYYGRMVISGNQFVAPLGGNCIVIGGNPEDMASNVVITGNSIDNCSTGIWLQSGAQSVSVTSNNITASSVNAILNSTSDTTTLIAGNYITGVTGWQIQAAAYAYQSLGGTNLFDYGVTTAGSFSFGASIANAVKMIGTLAVNDGQLNGVSNPNPSIGIGTVPGGGTGYYQSNATGNVVTHFDLYGGSYGFGVSAGFLNVGFTGAGIAFWNASTMAGSPVGDFGKTANTWGFHGSGGVVIDTATGYMLNASSSNTGGLNIIQVANSGTSSNSSTFATFIANLTGLVNGTMNVYAQGGATPSGSLNSGSGLTGGFVVSSNAGPITFNPKTTLQFQSNGTATGILTTTGFFIGGSTTPLNRLDVNGGVAIGSYAGANAAPSNGLIVSGNVGIGTSSPVNNGAGFGTLTLNGTTSGALEIQANGTKVSQIYASSTTQAVYNTEQASSNHLFQINSTNAVNIQNGGIAVGSYAGVNTPPSTGLIVSGAVGIGNTGISSYKLAVTVSDGGGNGILLAGATDGIRLYTTNTGTVLEGTDNTGQVSFQPFTLGGSLLKFTASGTLVADYNASIGNTWSFHGSGGVVIDTATGTMLDVKSSNTGGANALYVENSGTVGTAGTIAQLQVKLSGVANSNVFLEAVGGGTPSSVLSSGSNLSGGLLVQVNAGPFVVNAATTLQFQSSGSGVGDYGLTTASVWTFPAITLTGAVILSGTGTDSGLTHSRTICQSTSGGVVNQLYFGSGTGGICIGTSASYAKENIQPIPYGLAEIMKTDAVTFRFREGFGDSGARQQVGFIADNMALSMPLFVRNDEQGRPAAVDYMGVVPVVFRALQQIVETCDAPAVANDNFCIELKRRISR
jgi:Chaperone of endosialidase/Phage Tail Collar Domain